MKTYHLRIDGAAFEVAIDDASGGLRATVTPAAAPTGGSTPGGDGDAPHAPAHRLDLAEIVPGCYSLLVDGRSHTLVVAAWRDEGSSAHHGAAAGGGTRAFHLLFDGVAVAAEAERSPRTRAGANAPAGGAGLVRAPMPGLVVAIHTKPGAQVVAGQPLIIMEAMKMQMEIRAPQAGVVREIHVAPGRDVGGNDVLVTVE